MTPEDAAVRITRNCEICAELRETENSMKAGLNVFKMPQPVYHKLAQMEEELATVVSDRPCNVRREGGQSLVLGGPSLVILEGKACNPL